MTKATAPGRLGDPGMSLATEPRVDGTLLKALQRLNIHEPSYLTLELSPEAPIEDIQALVLQNEAALEGLLKGLDYDVQHPILKRSISRSEDYAKDDSGRSVRVLIFRPLDQDDTLLPAVIYFHGGGMIMLTTENPMHITWAESLAKIGFVVIVVDFQNVLSATDLYPFPTGLNDCATAIKWAYSNRKRLRVDQIILQGESGGANLGAACALLAKREGWIHYVQAVCGHHPYLSGAYAMPQEWKLSNLPSLVECDGYLINNATSVLNARLYDPTGTHSRNPLAWPLWASEDELRGLPPHLIVTAELDPLRDEGHAYARKLEEAGVKVVYKMKVGMVHEAELFLRKDLPELFIQGLQEMKTFVETLV